MKINREELAWAAGFFDGEGNTGSAWSSPIHVQVSNTDLRLLQRFWAALGVGRISGPYTLKNRPQNRPHWHWAATSFEDAQAAIALLWVWLSESKRKQAAKALRQYRDPAAATLRRERRRAHRGVPT
jgi:hypothetical protein